MLWYLHLCSVHKIVVTDYVDDAKGVMEESEGGKGKFTSVTLNPIVTIEDTNRAEEALELHHKANEMCFIANSCNFKIQHNAKVL
jgi:organic hydroperoxide reductase OsmC/OhrA